jgi:hypothetical protein
MRFWERWGRGRQSRKGAIGEASEHYDTKMVTYFRIMPLILLRITGCASCGPWMRCCVP